MMCSFLVKTLLNTGYKLYTLMSGRMKRENEEKGVTPDSQAEIKFGAWLMPG
jgi:hypothetical protein